MKSKRNLTILSLVLIMGLVLPTVQAQPALSANQAAIAKGKPQALQLNTDAKPAPKPEYVPYDPEDLSLEEYDYSEEEIRKMIEDADTAKALELDEEEEVRRVVWICWTRGKSYPVAPTVDAANPGIPMNMRIAATYVKTTDLGKVYEINRGYVRHGRRHLPVTGKALLLPNGIFVMMLESEGNDFGFFSIGRIAKANYGVWVAMKGYLSLDDVGYTFHMKGRAIPIGLWRRRIQSAVQNKPVIKKRVQEKVASIRAKPVSDN